MNEVQQANVGVMAPLFKPCRVVDKTTVSDEMFGVTAAYADGANLDAYIQRNNTLQAQVAEQQSGKRVYTVIVPQPISLERGTILRRVEDDLLVILKENTKGSEPPPASTVKIAKASAEEWVMPSD